MNDTPNRMTDRLSGTERERRWPNVRPKDAATLIVLDRSGKHPKVLMGRRNPGHKFMPGVFVFPGGRIEACDRAMPVAGALDAICEARLLAGVVRPSLQRARALALAAIRETCEETGLLIGTTEHGPPAVPAGSTWEAFAEAGVFPTLEPLHFVARATTPPRRPKRFDTRFFAVDRDWIAAERPAPVGPDSELVEIAWVGLAEAHRLETASITQVVLEELEARVAAGFGRTLPVPYYFERNLRFVRHEL